MATKYAWDSQPSAAYRVIQVKTPEGITLSLCNADIVYEQVHAVVNSCSCDLQLNQGSVSSTLLSVGGTTLQNECRATAPNGVQIGKVVLTSGGQLKCQYVIHAACCSWSDGADNCKQILRTLMVNIFQTAHNHSLQSVTLPALGTGQRKRIPPHLVATILLDELQKFSRQNPQTKLRDIRVAYPNIDQILWAFEEVLLNGSAGLQNASQKSSSRTGSSDEVEVVGPGTVKTKEGIVISLCKSEIARQQVGAIVNTPGRQLHLNSSGAVSKSLVKIGGPSLQQECARCAPNGIEFGEVVLTSGGNLQCDYVVHGACCNWRENKTLAQQVLRSLVANSLMEIHNKNLTSIAFPAIGTGYRKFPPDFVATTMLEEVVKFSHLYPDTQLRDVRFVLHPSSHPNIQAFSEVMFKDSAPTDITLKTSEGIVLSLHKSTIADEQVDAIVNTPTRKLHLRHGALSSSLLKAGGKILEEECHRSAPEGIQYGETVVTSGGRLRCRVVIHGACCDWIERADMCKEVLRRLMTNIFMEVHSKNFTSVAFPSIGTGQRNFPPHLVATIMLEELVKFSHLYPQTPVKDVRFVVYPKDYETSQAFEEVLLGSCCGLQEQFHAHPVSPDGAVSRTPFEGNLELPSNWSAMDESEFVKLEELASGSSEYQEVKTFMMSTAQKNVTCIHKIERIQNPSLYIKYMVHRQDVKKRCGESAVIERSLWHGTSEDAVTSINTDGFNRSYCGKNATAFGQGVYFAVNSSYSCGYANPRSDGTKQMYLAFVLTGDYTPGNSSYRVTPDNPGKPGFKFDSVVDNISNPQMFVIFLDNQAYPKYLITFE